MNGLTLFDEVETRASDPATSAAAAAQVDPGPTEQAILAAYRAAGERGLTDDELVGLLCPPLRCAGTVKSARSRLSKPGVRHPRPALLDDSGLPKRSSAFGRDMTVWVLASTDQERNE